MKALHTQPVFPGRQRGIVAIFATIAMAVLIGAGALALDVGNMLLSKGKLQNLADSAALSAAKTLDLGGTQAEAIAAGTLAITDNLASDNYRSVSIEDTDIIFEFSEQLPFDPTTTSEDATYVRVRIEGVDIPDFLVTIFNIDMIARASAVAGPSTTLSRTCNIVPLSICEGDSDPSTISGYSQHSLHVLKASTSSNSEVGSGNFMAITLTDADGNSQTGANAYRDALAGKYDSCLNATEGEMITTETGNMVGPTLAVDTRFGIYSGGLRASEYVSDINPYYDSNYAAVEETTVAGADGQTSTHYSTNKTYDQIYNYDKYMASYENGDYESCMNSSTCQSGGFFRRIVTVPILDCDKATKTGGRMDIPLKGLGCFYLVQPVSVTTTVDDKSGSGQGSWIIGEFISQCRNDSGNASNQPGENGPYKIVLFDDPDSEDS
ncbi:pilus assembly protein TadG-related protein [Photobacterium ganghwense]|uniref:pilus assembly protein TadG-related protein n=1 Tax=Photobacterium ganghwense TaxID=320778 RepID=UPI0040568A87